MNITAQKYAYLIDELKQKSDNQIVDLLDNLDTKKVSQTELKILSKTLIYDFRGHLGDIIALNPSIINKFYATSRSRTCTWINQTTT